MKPTICLAMIVRDEEAVIARCLETARPFIDRAVIVDTGSTDGTIDAIHDFFRALDGLPYEIHERPWVNFGHNRSELLGLARGKADYLLTLDADMTVEQIGDWPSEQPDAGMVRIPSDDMDYRLPLLIRGDLPWRSVGATHEYLDCDENYSTGNVDHLIVHHHLDGGARAQKFERDRILLEQENPDDPRAAFYLAQTYRDLGMSAAAVDRYVHRAHLSGFAEEVYCSWLEAGKAQAERGFWDSALTLLIRAWESRPARLEALYEITSRLRLRGEHHAAHAFAVQGLDREPPDDILFVAPWVYRYGLLFEFSIAAYWIGDHQASLKACDRLLEMDDLPEAYREQTERNRDFALGAVGAAA